MAVRAAGGKASGVRRVNTRARRLGLIGVATPPTLELTAEQVMASSLPHGTA